ncbi:MAG: nucleotidyltransferase domain-containing protein [Peptococcaceae bacterium]|nr:nucleotidyltransferase domain-containing protein [Peptococcaceae bacterium]
MENHIKQRIVQLCQNLGIDVCYLFGSRADGTACSGSDIDLAVAFKDYDGKKYGLSSEISMQQEFEDALRPYQVDLLLIQRAPIILKFKIINGVVLFSSDENFRTDLEEAIVRDYLDFKPFLDAYYREMAESFILGKEDGR